MTSDNSINTERDVRESNSHIYDRIIDVLEFQNEHSDMNWRDIPELVHIDIENSGEISSIKNIVVFEHPSINGLQAHIYYIPAKLRPQRVKRTNIGRCECLLLDISDEQQVINIRELYGRFPGSVFNVEEPSNEEMVKHIDSLLESVLWSPKEEFMLLRIREEFFNKTTLSSFDYMEPETKEVDRILEQLEEEKRK